MKKKNVIEIYKEEFVEGKTYNYYLDSLRFTKEDTWITVDEWINFAEICISRQNNTLQALEILIVEEYDKYYSMADKILTEWYDAGAYDIEYYYNIIAFMPTEYPIRKEIVGDYSDYLVNYSVGNDALMRESLIRSKDVDFCKIYGQYLDREIQKYKDDFEELASMVDANYITDLGKDAYKYVGKNNLDIVKNMFLEYIKKDKEMALKILDGYVAHEEEQTLWIIDHTPKVAFYMGWTDILEYLSSETWYWDCLFDSRFMYEDDNNTNLLIWSNYICNDTLKERAYALMDKKSRTQIDGAIALTRMESIEDGQVSVI